jgi:tight adherence protein B
LRIAAGLAAGVAVYLATGLALGVLPAPKHARSRSHPLTTWLDQAGVSLHPLGWVVVSGVVGFVAAGGVVVATGSLALGCALGVAATGLPSWHVARRRARRLGEAARAWPDALRFLAASLRSGRTLPAALEDLAQDGPAGLTSAFGRFEALSGVFGPRVALELIRDELADPLSDRVVEVLVTALARGGPLVPELLRDMADSTAEDLRTDEEITTNSLELRLNARVVTLIPWVVLLLLTVRPGPFRDFYASPAGTAVIVAAAALTAVGFVLLSWFGRISAEPRLVQPRSEP